MVPVAPSRTNNNTNPTQVASGQGSPCPAGRHKARRPAPGQARLAGDARRSRRDPGRAVIELECGIMVYPPEEAGAAWRATFTENGRRRFRQGATEAELAARLEKVTERLAAGAPDMERLGADLIAYYLDPDRLPPDKRWSRKHAHTQRRLCERFAGPVIDTVACQDITTWHTQQIINAPPTAGEGKRVAGMISALVTAGIDGGYLANPRLAKVHWQAAGRPLPPPRVSVAGESALWADPAEIPADHDIAKLALARPGSGSGAVTADLLTAATDPLSAVLARDAPGGANPRRVRQHAQAVRRRVPRRWNTLRSGGIAAAVSDLIAAAKTVASGQPPSPANRPVTPWPCFFRTVRGFRLPAPCPLCRAAQPVSNDVATRAAAPSGTRPCMFRGRACGAAPRIPDPGPSGALSLAWEPATGVRSARPKNRT
jgi:hypothetical protein